jgi:uncharacterized integral membrane protein
MRLRSTPVPPKPELGQDRAAASPDHQATVSGAASAGPPGPETRGERLRRLGRRGRLHGYAFVAVAMFAFLIALAASNTARVKVSWVFGTSRVALVWLVLFTAILGWLLGILITSAFRWRTRAPRR